MLIINLLRIITKRRMSKEEGARSRGVESRNERLWITLERPLSLTPNPTIPLPQCLFRLSLCNHCTDFRGSVCHFSHTIHLTALLCQPPTKRSMIVRVSFLVLSYVVLKTSNETSNEITLIYYFVSQFPAKSCFPS